MRQPDFTVEACFDSFFFFFSSLVEEIFRLVQRICKTPVPKTFLSVSERQWVEVTIKCIVDLMILSQVPCPRAQEVQQSYRGVAAQCCSLGTRWQHTLLRCSPPPICKPLVLPLWLAGTSCLTYWVVKEKVGLLNRLNHFSCNCLLVV